MIRTAGFDTHVWGPSGKAYQYSPSAVAAVTADKAQEYNAILSDMLSRLGLKRNPSRKEIEEAEKRWREKSQQKVSQLAASVSLKDRYRIVRKAMEEAGIGRIPSSTDGLAVVFYSNNDHKDSIASFSINTGNQKTGPTSATNVTQASCPNGENNASGYRCPLLGQGCYAEETSQKWVTQRHNSAAGFDPKNPHSGSKYSVEEIAEAEAFCLDAAYQTWELIGLNNGVRLHVVGDCVTPQAARIVSRAAEKYVMPNLQGAGVRTDSRRKNVWNYTHAWREVPRSAWSPGISVFASCDRIEDLEEAADRGYAPCVVVPDYVQKEAGKYSGKGIQLKNGWTLLPCPYEVGMKNAQNERVWCIECGFCLKDDFFRSKKFAVAFAAHTDKSVGVANRLIQIEEVIRK